MPDIITTGAAMSPVGAKLYGKDADGVGGWSPLFPPKRPLTIVLLGDSITVGNSNGLFTTATGPFTWANMLSGRKFTVLKNAGVGSETSTQVLARVDVDVIAYDPGYCMVLCGTNDPEAGTATIKANLEAIYNKLSQAGIYTFFLTMTPLPSATATKKGQIIDVNRWLMSFCLEKGDVECIDIFNALVAPSSTTMAVKTGALRDTTHPSNYGGIKIAEHLNQIAGNSVQLISNSYDARAVSVTSSNHTKNPLMLGTTGDKIGDVTGDVATDFRLAGYTGAVVVGAKAAHPLGLGEVQRITVSSITSATGSVARMLFQDPVPLPLAGEKFYMECELKIVSGTSLRNIYFYFINGPYLAGEFGPGSDPGYPLVIPTEGLNLTLRTPVYTFLANETASIELRLDVVFMAADGTAIIDVGRAAFIKTDRDQI